MCCDTQTTAEHIAFITSQITNLTACDIDFRITARDDTNDTVGDRSVILVFTHRSDGTTTINGIVNQSRVTDGNLGVTVNTTCCRAEDAILRRCGRKVIIGIATTTAAEHTATEDLSTSAKLVFMNLTVFVSKVDHLIFVDAFRNVVVSAFVQRCTTNGTAADGDFGVAIHVAVLTAAEHAADHLGIACNGNRRLLGKAHGAENQTGFTTAGAVDATFVATEVQEGAIDLSLAITIGQVSQGRTDETAIDEDGSLTAADPVGDGVVGRIGIECTHRSQSTTAVDVVTNLTASDRNLGVAIHTASCNTVVVRA